MKTIYVDYFEGEWTAWVGKKSMQVLFSSEDILEVRCFVHANYSHNPVSMSDGAKMAIMVAGKVDHKV